MDFNKARTFIEVVDGGSITLAANRLLRTQQAISLQLRQLEDELEIVLFDRQGPKITLNSDGEKLYKQFKPQLLAMENAVLELKSGKQQASGVIRIGAWMEQAVGYLPEMIRVFKGKHPFVDFQLHVGEDLEIEQMLLNNEIEIGIQLFCRDKKLFKCEAVYRQPLIPVTSRVFLKTNKAAMNIMDTLDLPLVDYVDEYSAYNSWIRKNARELLPLARRKLRTITASNNVVLKQLVLQGLGFGFLHQESIQAELDMGELLPLINKSKTQNISVDIEVVYRRKHTLGYVQQSFIRLLRENRANWTV